MTDDEVSKARQRDLETKQKHQQNVNDGKYRIESQFNPGEHVLIRNYQKQRKFDPTFLPDDYQVVQVSNDGRCITVERLADGVQFKRHPDDLKRFPKILDETDGVTPHDSEQEIVRQFIEKCAQITNEMENTVESLQFHNTARTPQTNTRMTRSQGQCLVWNPQMSNGDVLLPTAANNNQVNMLNVQQHWV